MAAGQAGQEGVKSRLCVGEVAEKSSLLHEHTMNETIQMVETQGRWDWAMLPRS